MSYKLIVAPKVKKSLKKLNRRILKEIDETILELEKNPFPIGCKKLVNFNFGKYRIRVGD